MAISDVSKQEAGWATPAELVQRVIDEANTGAGGAEIAANVPQLTGGESPTEAEFNALLTALKTAGLMVAD